MFKSKWMTAYPPLSSCRLFVFFFLCGSMVCIGSGGINGIKSVVDVVARSGGMSVFVCIVGIGPRKISARLFRHPQEHRVVAVCE